MNQGNQHGYNSTKIIPPPILLKKAESKGRSLLSMVRGESTSSHLNQSDLGRDRKRWLPQFEPPSTLDPDGEASCHSLTRRGSDDGESSRQMYELVQAASQRINESSRLSQPADEAAAGQHPAVSFNSKCFSLETRVTSAVIMKDGLHIIAAFASGSIRIFDVSSNDCDDIHGSLLENIEASTAFAGALKIHLEIIYFNTQMHLFASACLGSTKMIIIDVRTLLALKKERGFIHMKGVPVFTKSEGRLRGFSCAIGVSSTKQTLNTSGATSINTSYHLLCGKGYGASSLWQVEIRGMMDPNDARPTYSDTWTELLHIAVNGPALCFGCFVPQDNQVSSLILLQAPDKAARLHTPANNSMQTLTNMHNLRANSINGAVIFSGTDELIVSKWNPNNFNFDSTTHALNGTNQSRGRHLRQVNDVHCTENGSIAVIVTSDNSVFLYSEEAFVGLPHNPSAHLCLLFQARDTLKIECTISLLTSTLHDTVIPLSNILLAVCWWSIAHPAHGGTMLLSRLTSDSIKSLQLSSLCLQGIGLIPNENSNIPILCTYCKSQFCCHWEDILSTSREYDEVRLIPESSHVPKRRALEIRENTSNSENIVALGVSVTNSSDNSKRVLSQEYRELEDRCRELEGKYYEQSLQLCSKRNEIRIITRNMDTLMMRYDARVDKELLLKRRLSKEMSELKKELETYKSVVEDLQGQISNQPLIQPNPACKPYCIKCESYTADVCFVSCGHICLCSHHMENMRENNTLSHCPVCKANNTGTCLINSD